MIGYMMLAAVYLSSVTHARTEEERSVGLMERRELADGEGMVFHYPDSDVRALWMYRCFVPLEAAFLDEAGRILEIRALPCYPEMAEAAPKQIDPYNPYARFFLERAVISKAKARTILEIKAGFFEENGIRVGMKVHWDQNLAWIDNK